MRFSVRCSAAYLKKPAEAANIFNNLKCTKCSSRDSYLSLFCINTWPWQHYTCLESAYLRKSSKQKPWWCFYANVWYETVNDGSPIKSDFQFYLGYFIHDSPIHGHPKQLTALSPTPTKWVFLPCSCGIFILMKDI